MNGNLFADLPAGPLPDEMFTRLLERPGLRIERIVSTGQASPDNFWYDQPDTEWVLLLRGSAALRFADEPAARILSPGDHIEIAPHRRHRVDSTSPTETTVWLAVHFAANPAESA
jgi:cupin 2 domain-containing protein